MSATLDVAARTASNGLAVLCRGVTKSYGSGDAKVTAARIGQAIASFERTLLSVRAPIDRYIAGEQGAISESARRGWTLYNGKARCNNCHGHVESFPLFTDDLFHNIGVGVTRVDFEKVSRRAAAPHCGHVVWTNSSERAS